VLALALLLGILAAAGVFSSGSKPTSLAPTTTQSVTTPAVTTTPTTTAKPTVPVPTSGLKPGDKGGAVKQLQRALKSAGYTVGKIDGSYGPSTESAVKQFQQAQGLTADGIAGSKTLAALRSALS
jgi:peptidoglycan hydrolase-like protein with peptidoglycan-binding domain